ncbi:MAG: Bug family tripartite tricarboxylate transporter substrate binding protein, partial [Burkholderiales bacterium]
MFELRNLFLALLLTLVQHSALGQSYPAKPVRVIVPFPPAGATDLAARIVADHLARTWGQPVVVENRSGASGMLGTEVVAKAAPDGYTILLGTLATNIMAYLLYPNVPYAQDAFAPVILLSTTPNMLLANGNVPAATLPELIAYAKARPGKVSYASAGVGLSGHVGTELFAQAAGLQLLHVPYRGSAPSGQAFAAGQVDLVLSLVPESLNAIQTAGVKPMAVAAARRAKQFPGVPTFAELGFDNVQVYALNGLMVPAGTPRDIIEKIYRDAKAALASTSTLERFDKLGLDPVGGDR